MYMYSDVFKSNWLQYQLVKRYSSLHADEALILVGNSFPVVTKTKTLQNEDLKPETQDMNLALAGSR